MAGIVGVVYLKGNYKSNTRSGPGAARDSEASVEYVFGRYYDVKVSIYLILRPKIASGGGLALADGNRVLLTTGDGDSYLLFVDEADYGSSLST
ncbi:hypothetical protein AUC70_12470 [Methyloceanibacter stevinii]|uniref:Uncharacterized protein n=1 Tax=Methyloceanibacter stevinii TaxID=1774970 RepID=A0A1E3VJG0_9HYPH|nr:hypothetical protein AUC70_12470 [Methyloceanibacter stevinii]